MMHCLPDKDWLNAVQEIVVFNHEYHYCRRNLILFIYGINLDKQVLSNYDLVVDRVQRTSTLPVKSRKSAINEINCV